ncbi:ABC transporter permease [Actinomadura sp. KC216]|uniref:ABC transporter permease n=1 Tax=Actinomadura sp. KC216 TaxID=2530370 RepID=UPI00104E04CD|nr:ABC transporter permease [Actinomadura sp. KC216]TDB83043.1 ABC transporter permease [Actinomadura sp. KC216]
MNAVYTRYEIVQTLRNRRLIFFSLGLPLLLFLLVAGPNRHQQLGGLAFPVYYMTGMVSWGTMAAVMATGSRIAAERADGWNRHLRVSPLPARAYFAAKAATGYLLALISMAVLSIAAAFIGVRLSASGWLIMTGLVLVGLIPFTVLGVLIGHLVTSDAIGPATGGTTALFALLGGSWGPLAQTGTLHRIAEALPSYWLVQAARAAIDQTDWPLRAWVVVAVWTGLLTVLATRAYRRDTARP